MTGPERGFLLLASPLGDPERKCLTLPQLRVLSRRVAEAGCAAVPGEVTPQALSALGYGPEEAQRIAALLGQERLLEQYLRQAQRAGVTLLTRISPGYPPRLRKRLWPDAPAVLCLRGDPALLSGGPTVGLVGSRALRPENRAFAQEAGRQAAAQGYTLVSGGAKGADLAAQEACLAAGGRVISFVSDRLLDHAPGPGLLLCSEAGFELPFSAPRALARNRLIHALADRLLVAQCAPGTGGTWAGAAENLRRGWSPVFVLDDGSAGAQALSDLGAGYLTVSSLADLGALTPDQHSFL